VSDDPGPDVNERPRARGVPIPEASAPAGGRRDRAPEAQATRVWPGVLAWAAVCVGYLALEAFDVVEGLAPPVPLIAALVTARVVDEKSQARRVARVVAWIGVMVTLALAVAVWWSRTRVLMVLSPSTLAALLAAAGGAVAIGLIRRARTVLLRPLGLDPNSAVHAVVAVAAAATIVMSVVLFVELTDQVDEKVSFYPSDSLVSVLSDGALALAGVGFLLSRGPREALGRLDLKPIRVRQVAIAALLAVVFLGVVDVMERAESVWLPSLHALEDRFDYEFVGMPPVIGAVLLSLAAGVGEELVFRGALQPRLGIVATSVLFAAVHVQYQIPGMVMIFLVAVGLGIVKTRTSTTFTACVHVFYDMGTFFLP
jgi:membrane protease YdiL (CAAX protease family)